MQSFLENLTQQQIDIILNIYTSIEAWLTAVAEAVNDSIINEDIFI